MPIGPSKKDAKSEKSGFYQLNTLGANIYAGGDTLTGAHATSRTDSFWTLFGSVSANDRALTEGALGDGNSTVAVLDGSLLDGMYNAYSHVASENNAPPNNDIGPEWR